MPRPATATDTLPVAYKQRINVNRPLTVFLLPAVILYSSGVQQPGHATAVLSGHPHTRWPAPFNHEQDRASSYGSALGTAGAAPYRRVNATSASAASAAPIYGSDDLRTGPLPSGGRVPGASSWPGSHHRQVGLRCQRAAGRSEAIRRDATGLLCRGQAGPAREDQSMRTSARSQGAPGQRHQ
jgi:hypothetical protein